MPNPLPEDVLCRTLFNRCAIAEATNDDELRREIVRDLNLAEGKVWLTIVPPGGSIATNAGPGIGNNPVLRGRPMIAKFPGRCAVCRLAITVGQGIFYNSDQKRAAHERCGEPE